MSEPFRWNKPVAFPAASPADWRNLENYVGHEFGWAYDVVVIEPGSVVCSACRGDLVDGPGCAVCGPRDGEEEA
jgi:hypothetical protein